MFDLSPFYSYEMFRSLLRLWADIVGSADATWAVIDIYDVLRDRATDHPGADWLSEHLDALVLVADFFGGAAMDESWFPPDTDEKEGTSEAIHGRGRPTRA